MTNIVKFQAHPATKFALNGLIDNFFGRELSDIIGHDAVASVPSVNVSENVDGFTLELAAPGFDKSDITINVEKEHLVLSANKASKTEESSAKNYVRREFRYENFKRSFKLPNSVNQEAISAVYENGVLLVSLPKKEEAKPLSKQIQVL
jgi:HSP20 family protein